MSRRRKHPNRNPARPAQSQPQSPSAQPSTPGAKVDAPLQLFGEAPPDPEPASSIATANPGDRPEPDAVAAPTLRAAQGLGQAYTFALENAGSPMPTGAGNPGNLLDRAMDLLAPLPPVAAGDREQLHRLLEQRREQIEEAATLEQAAAELAAAERAAAAIRRRIARRQRALARALELEERRAAGGLYANEQRAPNRPCHGEVVPTSWDVLKRDALERGLAVGRRIGSLVADAATAGLPLDAGVVPPGGERRFMRLQGVDDATWQRFRISAQDAGLTVAAALGAVVEAEAERLRQAEHR